MTELILPLSGLNIIKYLMLLYDAYDDKFLEDILAQLKGNKN